VYDREEIMKVDLAKYFTKSCFARWPIWKTVVSGALAVAIAGTGATATLAAVASASSAPSGSVPASSVTPAAPVLEWTDMDFSKSGIVAADQVGTEEVQMELSTSQQAIGLDLYSVNSVTGKRTPFTGVDVTITLTCKSLTKVKESSNQYENDACKEGAVSTYALDTKTGTALIKKMNPGEYAVSVACADSSYIMPGQQTVKVKEKVSYNKVKVEVQKQDASTAKEDVPMNNGGGEAVTLSPNVTGKGYAFSSTKTWTEDNKTHYLYYKDGKKSAYKLETMSVTGSDGNAVEILSKAVFDENMQKKLEAAASSSSSASGSSNAPSTSGTGSTVASAASFSSRAAVLGNLSLMRTWNKQAGLSLIPLEASSVSQPAGSSSSTSAPSESTTTSPAPSEGTTPTPTPTETPTATPTETPTPTPTATPTPSATPTATPSATPTATPTSTPVVPTRPPYATQTTYELFSSTNGSLTDCSSVFQLPQGTTVITGGNSSAGGRVNGIDVSKYQGNIDWNAVKAAGVQFVIIRCGYRGYESGKIVKDPMFDTYIKGAKAAGLRVGVYFFSQAINEQEGVEEASACLSMVSGYGLNYPIFIDSEYSTSARTGRADGLSKADRTAAVVAFCETVRNSGYSAGVYASKNWYANQLNYATVSQYCVWNARYGSAPGLSCNIWQYTSQGTVPGIPNRVDLNISYIG
jgi:GH25 family lysozyme M1 (1,4-beta-N-acetylmuramidase)